MSWTDDRLKREREALRTEILERERAALEATTACQRCDRHGPLTPVTWYADSPGDWHPSLSHVKGPAILTAVVCGACLPDLLTDVRDRLALATVAREGALS